jgi:L-ribulose-5-phosphate 4-epimerase
MLESLKEQVCLANQRLVTDGLVTLTWGNVSGFDHETQLMVIKPSGVAYDKLEPADMPVVTLDGRVVEGSLRPSSDTPTHLGLYRAFGRIGGICHTHSRFATMFAQAREPIPCLGTTHADHFHGPFPVARALTPAEVEADYEGNTGRVIVECFAELDPVAMPGVLVAGHAPFTWGNDADAAVDNAVALEAVAQMVLGTRQICGSPLPLEAHILEKHYQRKHGPKAYYGQRHTVGDPAEST